MERDFKGIWIPKEIWLLKDLNYIQKILLIEIDSLNKEEWCFASNEYFADFFWISTTQISKNIAFLKKEWYIKEVWFDWRKRILQSCIEIKLKGGLNKTSNEPWRKVKGWYEENFKHNNIYNNTLNNTINNNNKNFFKNEELNNKLNEFIIYRKQIKKPITQYWIDLLINKINKWSNEYNTSDIIEFINNSIINNYQWIFEKKEQKKAQKKAQKKENNYINF